MPLAIAMRAFILKANWPAIETKHDRPLGRNLMRTHYISLLLAAPSLFAIATTAAAQTPAAQSTDTNAQASPSATTDTANAEEEIVVTARRRAESAQDVPLVVN